MNSKYKAVATLREGDREWNVTIYSHYNSFEEALEGVKHFLRRGYLVKRIEISEREE